MLSLCVFYLTTHYLFSYIFSICQSIGGRGMAHMASSRHVLDDFAKQLADVATVEKAPKVEGRSMTMFLTEKR